MHALSYVGKCEGMKTYVGFKQKGSFITAKQKQHRMGITPIDFVVPLVIAWFEL